MCMTNTKDISKQAQTVLALANAESKRLHCDHVASEHLLLGLMAYGTGRGPAMLLLAGLTLDGLRSHVAAVGSAPKDAPHGYGPSMHSVLRDACRYAEALRSETIAPQHLLLGLLDETDGGAYGALRHFKIDAATLKTKLLKRTPR